MNSNELTGGHLIAGRAPLGNEEWWPETYVEKFYNRIPITYGVELQFLTPVLSASQDDPHKGDPRDAIMVDVQTPESEIAQIVSEEVLLILRRDAGVPAWTHRGPPYPDRRVVATMDTESQAVSGMDEYSQWVVQTDQNLIPPYDPFFDYTWIGVRVKSNKRNSSWDNHFDEIAKVIIALRRNLRIRLPHTASLMVHVGEERWDPMSYDMGPRFLRVFCSVWWILERYVLDLVHPCRRKGLGLLGPQKGTSLDTLERCLPLREYSRLSRMELEDLAEELQNGGLVDQDFAEWYRQMHFILPTTALQRQELDQIESIWRAADAKSIIKKMTVPILKPVTIQVTGVKMMWPTEGRGSIGFQGFAPGAIPENCERHNNGSTGTIEFRSMESTLDPLLILNWVAVVIRLYDFCRRGNTGDIMAIIKRAQGDFPNYNGLQLLKDLGLPEQFDYFSRKIRTHRKDLVFELEEELFIPPYDEYQPPSGA